MGRPHGWLEEDCLDAAETWYALGLLESVLALSWGSVRPERALWRTVVRHRCEQRGRRMRRPGQLLGPMAVSSYEGA